MLNNREYIIRQAQEIEILKEIIEEKDRRIAVLITRLSRAEGKLNKIENYYKITEGREFK